MKGNRKVQYSPVGGDCVLILNTTVEVGICAVVTVVFSAFMVVTVLVLDFLVVIGVGFLVDLIVVLGFLVETGTLIVTTGRFVGAFVGFVIFSGFEELVGFGRLVTFTGFDVGFV